MKELLIVDDGGLSAKIGDKFHDLGYNVSHYFHPQDALRLLRSGVSPGVIVSDVYSHPSMDGIKFAKIVRRKYPSANVYLWSGRFSVGDDYALASLEAELRRLYLNKVIDGFAHKSPDRLTAASTIVDLVTMGFEEFAEKYGLGIGLENVEGLMRILGINLSLGPTR